jgi:G3E family GTPase
VYLINDEVAQHQNGDTVDGMVVAQWTKVRPMVGGCFTCVNENQTIEAIREETAAGRNVMLEGFGFVAGTETSEFLAKLSKAGVKAEIRVVALLDAQLFEKNRKIYGDDLIISQLQAATAGIGITRCNSVTDIDDPRIARQVEFAMRHAPGTPIFLAPEGKPLSQEILVDGEPHEHHHHDHHDHEHSCECCGDGEEYDGHEHGHEEHHHHDHDHTHEHHHDDVHGHTHAGVPHGFLLRAGVTYEQVRKVFSDELCGALGITRVKGAVGGRHYSAALGEWDQIFEDSRNFVTFYALARKVSVLEIPGLAEIAVIEADRVVKGSTKNLLRADIDDPEAAREAVLALIAEIPKEPATNEFGKLLTHPEELQTLRQIAQRNAVKGELFVPAIRRCVEYWIACARSISREGEATPERLRNDRALGLSLGWYAMRHRQSVGDELYAQIAKLPIGYMVAWGSLGFTQDDVHADEGKAMQFAEEVGMAVQFCISLGIPDIAPSDLWACMNAYRNAHRRAGASERVLAKWDAICKEVSDADLGNAK